MENNQIGAQSVKRDNEEDVSKRKDEDEVEDVEMNMKMQWQRIKRSRMRWFQMSPQVPCGSIIINQCTFQRTSV